MVEEGTQRGGGQPDAAEAPASRLRRAQLDLNPPTSACLLPWLPACHAADVYCHVRAQIRKLRKRALGLEQWASAVLKQPAVLREPSAVAFFNLETPATTSMEYEVRSIFSPQSSTSAAECGDPEPAIVRLQAISRGRTDRRKSKEVLSRARSSQTTTKRVLACASVLAAAVLAALAGAALHEQGYSTSQQRFSAPEVFAPAAAMATPSAAPAFTPAAPEPRSAAPVDRKRKLEKKKNLIQHAGRAAAAIVHAHPAVFLAVKCVEAAKALGGAIHAKLMPFGTKLHPVWDIAH